MRAVLVSKRRTISLMAALALCMAAVLWITMAPGSSSPRPGPDLSAHQVRYQKVFDAMFKNAPANVRLAAQQRYQEAFLNSWEPAWNIKPQGPTPCVNGHAGQWPCKNLDLLSYLPMSALGPNPSAHSNDLWGWTDPTTDKEYAILGRSDGTSFVDISDPANPIVLGNLPSFNGYESSWRAMKVYKNYAYVVADAVPHGMQVFDLTRLRNIPNPPVTFTADYHYTSQGMGNVHTLAVNEDTGYLYAVGSNTCSGGLHMIDVHTNPAHPTFAGCFSSDGYVHETQCVTYHGPDVAYQGHEVCFAHNEDTVTIIDVTNKANPVQISRTPYAGSGYTHQGWLTDDHRRLAVDDELDEVFSGHNAWTRFFDVRDLNSVPAPKIYKSALPNIDHNLYIIGRYIYQSHYRAGLRILNARPRAHEVAYFDVYPSDDLPEFNGSWNNYPFFASGVIVVAGIEQGLFVLQPTF